MSRSRYLHYRDYRVASAAFHDIHRSGMAPVFTHPDTVQILPEAFTYRQQNRGVRLYDDVILENHLHCILQSPSLEKQVKNWKSYTARQVIDYLRARNSTKLLAKLADYKKRYKTDREYQLWEKESHPQ